MGEFLRSSRKRWGRRCHFQHFQPPKMAAQDQIEIHMAYLIQIDIEVFSFLSGIHTFTDDWRLWLENWRFMNHAKNKYLLCLEVNRHQEKTGPTVYHTIWVWSHSAIHSTKWNSIVHMLSVMYRCYRIIIKRITRSQSMADLHVKTTSSLVQHWACTGFDRLMSQEKRKGLRM